MSGTYGPQNGFSLQNVQVAAVGMWLRVSDVQHSYNWKYMLDGRPGFANSYWAFASNTPQVGAAWADTIYVDGVSGSGSGLSFDELESTWTHLYFELTSSTPVDVAELHVLGASFGTEGTWGHLASISVYNRKLTAAEILEVFTPLSHSGPTTCAEQRKLILSLSLSLSFSVSLSLPLHTRLQKVETTFLPTY